MILKQNMKGNIFNLEHREDAIHFWVQVLHCNKNVEHKQNSKIHLNVT